MSSIEKFYYQGSVVEDNYRRFETLGEVHYPIKTNPNPVVIRTIQEVAGGGRAHFGIWHAGDVDYLAAQGVSLDQMSAIAVQSGAQEKRDMYNRGVRSFVFDYQPDLAEFLSYADLASTSVALRINPSVAGVYPDNLTPELEIALSRFGTDELEIREMAQELHEGGCSDLGVSFYLQGEFFGGKRKHLGKMLGYIATNLADCGLSFINIGGGVPFGDIDPLVLEQTKSATGANRIILEPGRYMVDGAVDLETSILHRVDNQSSSDIIINSSAYRGFLDVLLYNRRFAMSLLTDSGREVDLSQKPNDTRVPVQIFGDHHDPDTEDYFGEYSIHPDHMDDLKPDAKVIIKNTGAYVEWATMPFGGELDTTYHHV